MRQLESLGENIISTQMTLTLQQELPYWVLRELFEVQNSSETWYTNMLRKHLQKIVLRGEALDRTLEEAGRIERFQKKSQP